MEAGGEFGGRWYEGRSGGRRGTGIAAGVLVADLAAAAAFGR